MEYKIFIVYVVVLSINLGNKVYPLKKAQIAHPKADEAYTKVFNKYVDFADIFSPKLAIELSKHIKINNNAIKLMDD